MTKTLPSVEKVRERLKGLSHIEIEALANRAEVAKSTVWNLRLGYVQSPRIDTLTKIQDALPNRRRGTGGSDAE